MGDFLVSNAQSDSVYFKQRAEQEALAAAQSNCARAREAHGIIARRYFELCRELEIYDFEPELSESGKTAGAEANREQIERRQT